MNVFQNGAQNPAIKGIIHIFAQKYNKKHSSAPARRIPRPRPGQAAFKKQPKRKTIPFHPVFYYISPYSLPENIYAPHLS